MRSAGQKYTPARVTRGLARRARVILQGVASTGPKLWFGNSAGWRNNVGARSELIRLRSAVDQTALSRLRLEDRERAAHLQKEGYLRLPRMVGEASLEAIRQSVDEALNDPARSVASPNGATRFLLDPEKTVPSLCSLLTEDICRAVVAYYGCALRVESIRVWRNYHVPGIDKDADDRYSNTFHHDNCPINGLRIFILLSHGVTRETGAFRFHDRPTSERLVRSLGYFHRSMMSTRMRARLLNEHTLHHFEGDAGEVCICNTQQCLHAASVPRPGSHRDILQFEVYPVAGSVVLGPALCAGAAPDREIVALRASN